MNVADLWQTTGPRQVVSARIGLEPWLAFQEVEDQLRVIRPIVLHASFPSSMSAFYHLLAETHGYEVFVQQVGGDGTVSAMLTRKSLDWHKV